MAFGTGSEILFIEGQDFLIVWFARVTTVNRAGLLALLQLLLCLILLGALEQM